MSFLLKEKILSRKNIVFLSKINCRCLNRSAGKHLEIKGKKFLGSLYLRDLSKAFVTVDHSILLDNVPNMVWEAKSKSYSSLILKIANKSFDIKENLPQLKKLSAEFLKDQN